MQLLALPPFRGGVYRLELLVFGVQYVVPEIEKDTLLVGYTTWILLVPAVGLAETQLPMVHRNTPG